MRLRNVKNAKNILSESKYTINEPEKFKSAYNMLFGNSNPIHVEIGMGKGDFIIGMAEKYPNINFIGIEKYESVQVRAIQKLEEKELPNLRLIRYDAENIEEIFCHEIETLYLNFSDTWPKTRHAKRRLTSSKFLDEYKKVLKENGQIEFKTDNRGLFEYSLVSMQNYGLKFIEVYLDLHKTDVFNIETEYEKKFSPFGPIYKIIVQY